MVLGRVPVIELQDCNLSDPGGGTRHCLDSVLAGTTNSGDSVTLSQVFIPSSQHGTTSAEIYYGDLECAAVLPAICTPQSAYLAAVLALAAGQPSGTSILTGKAELTGKATMF